MATLSVHRPVASCKTARLKPSLVRLPQATGKNLLHEQASKAGVLARRFYIGRMKTFSMLFTAVLMAASVTAHAQDAALEERVNKLNGYVQDLLSAQDAQRKQIDGLKQEIQDLREKIGKSSPDSATQEDLRNLAAKLQEVDQKREADRELILKEIEALGKTAKQRPSAAAAAPTASTTPVNDKGYEYEIRSGDTLSAVVAAYREQGIKVSLDDVLKANPGLEPTKMKVGQKVFIPAPQ
jgi:LysM repeat protein